MVGLGDIIQAIELDYFVISETELKKPFIPVNFI